MATSTRKRAIELWEDELPDLRPEILAKILFACDNPPGTTEVSGSQDAIGIVTPGLQYSWYDGKYWPLFISIQSDDAVLDRLESLIKLVPLGPRDKNFDVLGKAHIDEDSVKKLSDGANECFQAIMDKNATAIGRHVTDCFRAQVAMFPNMMSRKVHEAVEKYKNAKGVHGYKVTGAGGGGYLTLVTEEPVEDALKIKIRR